VFGVLASVLLTASADSVRQYPGWANTTAVTPVFRATRRPADAVANRSTRSLSSTNTAGRRGVDGGFLRSDRAGARKAVPITRGQDLGLRFRPDERDPLSSPNYPQAPTGEGYRDNFELPAGTQFRPTSKKRKRTYEEIQAESRVDDRDLPGLSYPGLPMPPVFPGQLPYR
jgi:hypothetical protein